MYHNSLLMMLLILRFHFLDLYNLPNILTFCNIANLIECVAMFDFIASVPHSFLNNIKTPSFTFLGVKLGVCFAIC